MQSPSSSLNPFSLMMEPEMVLAAMERSDALRRLRHQVFHPLDKPGREPVADSDDLAAYDAAIEQSAQGVSIGLDEGDVVGDPEDPVVDEAAPALRLI